ncbi:hypothetical protein HYC85_006636 [Camellia sinensis]|uniref:RRM domain-containing protein n=1 Tax=Camellia sinensis TaxID=4442 RepID=A0A7J7HLM5_CAMSI|nr:hypothetical protein HYC85_006636 [Camellia sinensis]
MSNLDMSLDDIIKMNKKSGGGGGGGGGGGANPRGRARNSGPGPARRLPNRSSNRTTPYSAGMVQAPETTWQHDMFADHATAAYPAQVGRVSAIETGTKLFISNLDYGVSNEDIKELFAEVGDLKRYSIHYDRSGRSKVPIKFGILWHLLLSNESSQGRGGGALGRLQAAAVVVVPLDDLEVVAEAALGGAVNVAVEVVLKRFLLKILMPIWRSTTQKQCKQIDGNKQDHHDLPQLAHSAV